MPSYTLTLTCADRPGIVHNVTGAIVGLAGNIIEMSEFAAGERYINRVWSTSADGYDEEGEIYLQRAAQQFEDAKRQLADVGSRAARQ